MYYEQTSYPELIPPDISIGAVEVELPWGSHEAVTEGELQMIDDIWDLHEGKEVIIPDKLKGGS